MQVQYNKLLQFSQSLSLSLYLYVYVSEKWYEFVYSIKLKFLSISRTFYSLQTLKLRQSIEWCNQASVIFRLGYI